MSVVTDVTDSVTRREARGIAARIEAAQTAIHLRKVILISTVSALISTGSVLISMISTRIRQCAAPILSLFSHLLTHVARMPIPHTAVGARRQSPVHVGSPPLEKLQDGHGGLLSVFFRPLSGRRGTPWVRR